MISVNLFLWLIVSLNNLTSLLHSHNVRQLSFLLHVISTHMQSIQMTPPHVNDVCILFYNTYLGPISLFASWAKSNQCMKTITMCMFKLSIFDGAENNQKTSQHRKMLCNLVIWCMFVTEEPYWHDDYVTLYSVSQKIPPKVFWHFFSKRYGIFRLNFTYLLHVSIYAGLQIFIQLSAILWKLCYIKCDHPVHTICSECPPCMLAFSDIFPKQLGIFGPNFTHLLSVAIYARVQIFIQLSLTVMKLCHIKCDHPACFNRWWTFWAYNGGRA